MTRGPLPADASHSEFGRSSDADVNRECGRLPDSFDSEFTIRLETLA
jgi:hypothetical protein